MSSTARYRPTRTVAVAFAMSLLCCLPLSADEPTPRITVQGRGTAEAPPDHAVLRFGVIGQSKEAAAAQNKVNERVASIIKALKQLKRPELTDKDLRTSRLSLQPLYDNAQPGSGQTRQVRGYRASYTLTVRVDQIKRAGDVIDAALAAGVNQLNGIHFGLENDDEAKKTALQKAARDAKQKAQAVAEGMGVRLGKLIEVVEHGAAVAPPMPRMHHAMAADGARTSIQPGQVATHASLTVSYRIAN